MLPPHIKALILDMDGVIWKANLPIGDLASIFGTVEARGLKYVFATNNSTKTPEQYAERLNAFGVRAEAQHVVTSAQAVALAVAERLLPGSKVFMIGEDGIRNALEERKLKILPVAQADSAQAFVMGIDREITFDKVVHGTLLVRRGIPFYATNMDKTFPTPRGEIPGSGAWVSVITTATGIEPIVAGKPAPYLMDLALERLGTRKEETLVVGDRLETDVAAGQAVGCPTALVLSGVSTRAQAEAWSPRVDLIERGSGVLDRLRKC